MPRKRENVESITPVVHIDHVSKQYKLYNRNVDRVKETFLPFRRKRYHHPFHALTDVSMTIQHGATVGIVGRNGSGKSTLLQIICGILRPTSGTVTVDGRISALLELGAGFNPEFTGRENVYINGAILGLTNDEVDSCFGDIASFADIGDFIDQPVKTYSSGMFVRLAFAVAINVHPDILVVDEALSVGDTFFQAKCFAKFREFQQKGVTILFVTHSMDLITRYCTEAFLLEQGKVLEAGKPKDVIDEYNRVIVDCSKLLKGEETVNVVCGETEQEVPEEENFSKVNIHTHSMDNKIIEHMQESEKFFKKNPDENRYGNGKAEILEAGIESMDGTKQQYVLQGNTYKFWLKIRFNSTINEPILGYTIKDVKGADLTGTNTFYQDVKTGVVEPGQVLLSVFEQKITLNPGGYLLSYGCAGFEEGEYVVYDRRYDMFTFDVTAERSTVGIFDMDSTITVSRLE